MYRVYLIIILYYNFVPVSYISHSVTSVSQAYSNCNTLQQFAQLLRFAGGSIIRNYYYYYKYYIMWLQYRVEECGVV